MTRLPAVLCLAAVLSLGGLPTAPAGERPPDPELTPRRRAEIAGLIEGLGDEKFEVREAARKKLREIGRPALGQLRAAMESRDIEVSVAARELVAGIEAGKPRSTVKLTIKGSREKGNFEITVTSTVDTVTVRDFKEAFAVQIKETPGKTALYSSPTREEFSKKHPEVWKKYAEPALDQKHPERAVKEAAVRELLPQMKAKFRKAAGREANAQELAAMEKMLRAQLDRMFEKKSPNRKDVVLPAEGGEGAKPKPKPVEAPRRGAPKLELEVPLEDE